VLTKTPRYNAGSRAWRSHDKNGFIHVILHFTESNGLASRSRYPCLT